MIAVENLSGAQCDYLRRYRFAYPDTAESYCWDPAPARTALGLDNAGAEQAIETLLASPRQDRPAAERRRLAALMLATGDRASALVQWLRLPPGERVADATLTAPLVDVLNRTMTRRNESYQLAARLAARLGHERLILMDDHTGDRATGGERPTDEAQIRAIWSNPHASRLRDEDAAADRAMIGPGGDMLRWYRRLNSVERMRTNMAGDFGAAAGTDASNVGRRYLAYWETRNLRMVANIREAIGPTPPGRVLVIVGAAHKPHFERYLGMLSDVRVSDVGQVLR